MTGVKGCDWAAESSGGEIDNESVNRRRNDAADATWVPSKAKIKSREAVMAFTAAFSLKRDIVVVQKYDIDEVPFRTLVR